jgi:predicted site-specific integrase-resolvase
MNPEDMSEPQKRKANKENQVDRVRNFFQSRKNQEFLVKDIESELGIKRPQLSSILRVLVHTKFLMMRSSTREEHGIKSGKLPFYYRLSN